MEYDVRFYVRYWMIVYVQKLYFLFKCEEEVVYFEDKYKSLYYRKIFILFVLIIMF